MDFRNNGNKKGRNSNHHNQNSNQGKSQQGSGGGSSRFNVTPLQNLPQDQMNQLLLQQYFLQQQQEQGAGQSGQMAAAQAAAQAAAAAALFGGILGDKLGGGGGAGGGSSREQQITELFAAAAAAQQQQQQQSNNRSQSSTPSPRISTTSSPHHHSISQQQQHQQQQHRSTPSSSSTTSSSAASKKEAQAAAALAAQQQWMYLDYIQRIQQEHASNLSQQQQQQQQPPPASKRGRSNSRGGGGGNSGPGRKAPGRPPSNAGQNKRGGGGVAAAAAAASAAASQDLSRLLEQYNNNSLLKSSVLASAKLPADTEIIVQKNNRFPQQKTQNKRGPKPKNSTITSEQAKFEQQLINLGNNNAITITPANMDTKVGGSSSSSQAAQAPITITPAVVNNSSGGGGSSSNPPPPAHSTPFRYGNDKRDIKLDSSAAAQPAHKYVKELYTHVIPRKPQIGLIGGPAAGSGARKMGTKKQQQQQLQLQSQNQSLFRHHRPWMESTNDVSITPASTPPLNLNKEKKHLIIPKPAPEPIIISPPDYSVPIREGWKREMILKTFDLNEDQPSLACEITYISPEGKVYSSLNEIKKGNVPEPKNFTFNSKIQLGKFVLPQAEGGKRVEFEELIEYFNHRKLQEALRKKNLRMKHEHNSYVKLIEAYRKNRRKLKLNEKKHPDIMPKSSEVEELIEDVENHLPGLETVDGKHLNDKTFANLLQIHEFLHTFGETLGFDSESLPSLSSLQKAFLHIEDNEEELVSVLCHLLVCAVEDPGLPNPTGAKHLTPFGQTLKQADVTFGSMSEILRIYLNGISDSEPEAEDYAEWLEHAPFTAQSAYRKSVIVAFICDVLLQNKAVLRYLETCSELIHNCKKEKQQNEIRVRKLRMLVARKQVAASIEEGGTEARDGGEKKDGDPDKDEDNDGEGGGVGGKGGVGNNNEESIVSAGEDSMMQGDDDKPTSSKDPAYAAVASVADSISSDPDSRLSIEELNNKIAVLGGSSEKLKKQMQSNSKSIRSTCLGQDRWRRRYWNLYFSGGIYVEGGATGEFEEVRSAVLTKFEKQQTEPPPQQVVPPKQEPAVVAHPPPPPPQPLSPSKAENELNASENNKDASAAAQNKRSTPFTVPPPVIKIFSFTPRLGCSGAVPDEHNTSKLTDDELLVKHVQKANWFDWKCIGRQEELESFVGKLCEKGIREKNLKNQLVNCNFNLIPDLTSVEIDQLAGNPEDDGFVDPELLYKIHLGLIETLETLEERVASASLQVKGWALPSRNLIQESLTEEKIVEIVKERVLDLENAVERRYLKPPLGKSGLEVNLTQLLKESEDSYNLLLDGPIGSTSSTRGQQINENNKLKMELKEKERLEKEMAARKEKEEGGGGKGESRFLTHWRDAIAKTTSPSVLSMAIYILDSSIAWDKSVMKASCQLCKGGDNEDKLLLCDACDRGYHTYCFKPPLDNIPDGDWFCWECINKATGNKCCIVCGKGQVPNIKLLCCDKCVKAYHQDCINPPVSKAPRGRWFCPDHREGTEGKNYRVSLSHAVNVSLIQSQQGGGGSGGGNGSANTSLSVDKNSDNETPTKASSKKASPKKKKEKVVDGNMSDSSNSSSFVMNTPKHEPAAAQPSTPSTPAASAAPPPPPPATPSEDEKKPEKAESSSTTTTGSSKKKKKSSSVKEEPIAEVEKPVKLSKKQKSEMSWCEKILDDLVGHEDAWPFLEPVNTRQFPTYKKIIKTPMDLQTIKTRLVASHYKSKESFLQDVRVIFDNCETFNEDDSPVGKAGHSLRVFFESKPGVGTGNNSSSGGNGAGK